MANPAVWKEIEQKHGNGSKTFYTLVWQVDSYSPIIEYNLWFRFLHSNVEWTKLTIPTEQTTGPIHSKVFTLTGLIEDGAYEAKVYSRNRYGWSKPSKLYPFQTGDHGKRLNH